MGKLEFISMMIGKPWLNRAVSFESVDCWGLVIMYYRNVFGVELPTVDGYSQKNDIAECWANEASKSHWKQVQSPTKDGVVFTCYEGAKPTHVGITIGDGKVLHTNGANRVGGVQINSIKAIERLHGKMTYHKFIG